ncbi:hypothetical protein HII31_01073 [Pseudocercospora fuligena]|uniref:Uncharacterized protein n=1 Tax=Pseudocercospora fuligena TaxID=685502 RepID=A0A8H6VSV7_9PEZI|nr:hypothetical protein HII31_01073 [Pseudocercospora fuligena]
MDDAIYDKMAKSKVFKMKPLSRAEKVRRADLVAWLRTYKPDDPERAKLLREKHKHLDIDLLDDKAYEKAMEEERRARRVLNPSSLRARTPKQRHLQASGQPFSLHSWFAAGKDMTGTDSKRVGSSFAPGEGLAVSSKMPKSEPDSAYDSGTELQDSPHKPRSEVKAGSKASSAVVKGHEGQSSVQNPSAAQRSTRKPRFEAKAGSKNPSVTPKESKLTPGEKNQISPATKSADLTPRKGLAKIEKAVAPRSVLAALEKAERQESNSSAPSEADRKLDEAHAGVSSGPLKTSIENGSAVVPDSVRSAPRGAEHKGSLVAQFKLEHEQSKLQDKRERAQDITDRRNARAQIKAFSAPSKLGSIWDLRPGSMLQYSTSAVKPAALLHRKPSLKTEKPVVPTSALDAPVKSERNEGSCSALPKTFIKTEKSVVSASGLDAPAKRERGEGSCFATPKAFIKTETPVVPTSELDTPQKRERGEGSCSTSLNAFTKTERPVVSTAGLDASVKRERSESSRSAPPKAGPKPEQAQPKRFSNVRNTGEDTEKAVVLRIKTEQNVNVEVREIGHHLKAMTGPQEVLAARIVEAIAGTKYLQPDGLGICMDPKHPLPRRAHDALLEFGRWGIAADSKKAEAMISKYKAAQPGPRPEATSHLTERERVETEKQVPTAERECPASATFEAPGIKRKRVENEAPAPQKGKAEPLIGNYSSQETTSRSGASTHVMKRKREEAEEPASKKRKREEDEAPTPEKQKSQPAAEKENAPRQLPSFVRRHGDTGSSDRNLTWVEDTLYGRRRIQHISHNVRTSPKSQD